MLLYGNDQTGAALGASSWMEAGVETGAMPIWPSASLGDTVLITCSAVGILQALYLPRWAGAVPRHVDPLRPSAEHVVGVGAADGTPGNRPVLDEMQTGWSDRYRLHETGSVAVRGARHRPARRRLRAPHGRRPLRPDRGNGSRCSTAAGVPCEVADADFVLSLFDDPEMIEKGWVRSYEQPLVGRMDVAGMFDLDDTPVSCRARRSCPARTRRILGRLGYDEDRIELLCGRVARDRSRPLSVSRVRMAPVRLDETRIVCASSTWIHRLAAQLTHRLEDEVEAVDAAPRR